MKKIEAILKGLIKDQKVKNKVKRIELALQTAELNFKTAKDDNELLIDDILEKLNNPENKVETVISELSEAMNAIEEAELGIKRVDSIKKLLFTEVQDKE